jgi:UrcA family protein
MIMKTTNTFGRKSFFVRGLALSAIAMASMAVAATAVHAAELSPASDVMTKTVKFDDLNLANTQGVERLYRRIVAAAEQVCDTREGRSLRAQAQTANCTKQSIAHAVAAVGQPTLTALYSIKTGHPNSMTRLAKQ